MNGHQESNKTLKTDFGPFPVPRGENKGGGGARGVQPKRGSGKRKGRSHKGGLEPRQSYVKGGKKGQRAVPEWDALKDEAKKAHTRKKREPQAKRK